MSQVVIRGEQLSKRYRLGQRERYRALRDVLANSVKSPWRFLRATTRERDNHRPQYVWALKDVSFKVSEGEVVGIVGRNGAGKTTLLKILARVTRPTEGYAEVRGRMGSLLEVGTGFHPELTGRENVYLSGAILGMGKQEIDRKFDEIVAFAEVEDFIDTPLKHYSTGMQMRLAFAVAAHLEPEILLVDEVLAVGDLAFQKKCLGKMGEVARGGRTILFVSHQMNQIRRLCERAFWIDAGRVRVEGAAKEVVNQYEASFIECDEGVLEQARGPVAFTRWYIEESQSNLLDVDRGTAETVVKIHARVQQPIRKGRYFIGLRDGRNTMIWSNMYDDLALDPGEVVFVHQFANFPLNPGIYVWDARVFDGHHWFEYVLLPELSIASEKDSHVDEHVRGFLNLESSFAVQELSARAPRGVWKGFAGSVGSR